MEDLQPRPLLHRQVDQDWLVLQLWVQNNHKFTLKDVKITMTVKEFVQNHWRCHIIATVAFNAQHNSIYVPEKLLNAMNLW